VVAVAPEIKDEGKFFSADAVKKADAAVRELYGKYDKDLLIETVASVPAADVEKVKKMDAKERAKYFLKWARERAKARAANGVYVLVSKQPPRVETFITRKARSTFDAKFRKKLAGAMIEQFKDKHFDEGLAAAVKVFKEHLDAKAKKD
jgi:hypothetical protein